MKLDTPKSVYSFHFCLHFIVTDVFEWMHKCCHHLHGASLVQRCFNTCLLSVQCDITESSGACRSLLFADYTQSGPPEAPCTIRGVQYCMSPWVERLNASVSSWVQVCVCTRSQRLTHCCYASYECLKCVLGLNVSWGLTSWERHLCLPASPRTSITTGWTYGAWLHYISGASITAEQARTAPACAVALSSLLHGDLICGSSHLAFMLSVMFCW